MKNHSPANELLTCDTQPIHRIGAIQSTGFFVAFAPRDRKIMIVSQNVEELFRRRFSSYEGHKLGEFLPEPALERIIGAAKTVESTGRAVFFPIHGVGPERRSFQAYLHALDGLLALELEPFRGAPDHEEEVTGDAIQIENGLFIEELKRRATLEDASKLLCKHIRWLTGFQRVMLYRFQPNWEGVVIGEDRTPEAHSFMDHRFPATDIPQPARELYLKNRTRLIADATAPASVLEPQTHPLTGKPLDLTGSKLRAVAPIHLEYLKNMKVRASFSTAVIVDDRLWGLVACHGDEVTHLPHEIRLACEQAAGIFSIGATRLETQQHQAARISFETEMREFFHSLRLAKDPLSHLFRHHQELCRFFRCTGIAVASANGIDVAGLTPTIPQVHELELWLRADMKKTNKSTFVSSSLAKADPRWDAIRELGCGVMAISAEEMDNALFILFRRELLQEIVWGGDPKKLDQRNYQGQINPRKSFESWRETISHASLPWTDYEIRGIEYLRDFVFDALIKKARLIEELHERLSARDNPRSSHPSRGTV